MQRGTADVPRKYLEGVTLDPSQAEGQEQALQTGELRGKGQTGGQP